MPLSPAVLDILASADPVRAILLDLQFKTARKRFHLGDGPVRAGGYDWDGAGKAISISGLERSIRGSAPKATFALSGVENDHVASFLSQSSEVRGRRVVVYLQLYDRDRQPVDTLFRIYTGVMDKMSLKRGPFTSTLYVTAEGPFSRRTRAPAGTLSDRDQKRRFPDDRGLEMMAQVEINTPYWPIIIG